MTHLAQAIFGYVIGGLVEFCRLCFVDIFNMRVCTPDSLVPILAALFMVSAAHLNES